MKNWELFEALSYLDPKLIEEAKPRVMHRRASRLLAPIAAVLVLAIVLGIFFGRWNPFFKPVPTADPASSQGPSPSSQEPSVSSSGPAASSQAEPASSQDSSASYPAYSGAKTLAFQAYPTNQSMAKISADTSLDAFLQKTTAQFLSEAGSQNLAYSPLNLYFALAAAARCSAGETQRQILDLLGETESETLLEKANQIWKDDYYRDRENVRKTLFATSLWFDETLSPDETLLKDLGEQLYLSSYQGDTGSPEFTEAFHEWLSEQTGGNLDPQISGLGFSDSTPFAIAATLDYYSKWSYSPEMFDVYLSVFHGTGGDTSCEYLSGVWRNGATYFYGEKYTALSLELMEQGQMLFILPDEGYTPADLLSDEATIDLIVQGERARRENKSADALPGSFGYCPAIAYFSIPKFDFSSQIDLREGLASLGVTDCFTLGKADFSPLLKAEEAAISKADQAVRIAIDKDGISASAYTVFAAETGIPKDPPEDVCFIADRPFLFVITGRSGLPLFAGILNQTGTQPALPKSEIAKLLLETPESIIISEPGKADLALSEAQQNAFIHYLCCAQIESMQEPDSKHITNKPNQCVLTDASGAETRVSFATYAYQAERAELVRINDQYYRLCDDTLDCIRAINAVIRLVTLKAGSY